MYITYLRSSSSNSFDMCESQYYLSYTLGISWPSGKSACLGNVYHKCLEILANKAMAKRDGKIGYEDEIFGWLENDKMNYDSATRLAYKYYIELEPFHKWTENDLPECIKWSKDYLKLSGGIFNPENMNIIAAEKKFDFKIEKQEFRYHYVLEDGTILDDFLGLKGTVDLVVRHDNGVIEVIDHKSGKRKDWNTEEIKTHKKLTTDPQLLLYFYAMSHEFPEANSFLMTIIYINDGGAFSIPFDRENDLAIAEAMILKKFNEIRNTQKPKLKKTWKCSKLCGQGKNNFGDSGKTVCAFFEPLVAAKGTDKVFAEYGNIKKLTSYADGGGRKAKED